MSVLTVTSEDDLVELFYNYEMQLVDRERELVTMLFNMYQPPLFEENEEDHEWSSS